MLGNPERASKEMKGAYTRPLKQGYLMKQSEILKQWHLRYFVLSKECLCYYRTEAESLAEAPKEVIFFNDMSLYIDDRADKQTRYCLRLVKRSVSAGKIANRTLLMCCFSQDERNEWLSQILLAKAMALVADPTALIGNRETSTEHMDFELTVSGKNDRRPTAKELLRKCRRKVMLVRSTGDSLSSLLPENLDNLELKSFTLNLQHWRSSLMLVQS